jgi:hypothetical protein
VGEEERGDFVGLVLARVPEGGEAWMGRGARLVCEQVL